MNRNDPPLPLIVQNANRKTIFHLVCGLLALVAGVLAALFTEDGRILLAGGLFMAVMNVWYAIHCFGYAMGYRHGLSAGKTWCDERRQSSGTR